ncbi:single-stranded-DNA-specific exonuclease RecJ [Leptospira gomenensis]|uniref:Single-stranded-DNA-specific exonuclease RecJ n=1 Tax=Leptospira gomenensis TaxID=2484974 RepID=A0A5F1YHM9_9LEPT|nr:single-stranded-DNA-specific exonuclease RecJ [Leptospira gomenensis]TGK31480.1 single-stranded-DNA-specific exonuclease RecJ [Leptospira gomenensis]TGK32470.1 single-stranded-DNA-specific exonuclease RecJ [Leptospira gomenensis]TGK46185.1 single-stranded-DNA-specific exonuclease RecJ [Leptospira gomenensis]TGK54710.1 single-stranded-DNA-specific exonuclease RecJ [Leptospira gomenensis]
MQNSYAYAHGPGLKELSIAGSNRHLTPLQNRFYVAHLKDKSHPEHLLYHGLRELPSPFLLPDLEPALELLRRSVRDGKKILLFGDRDCDGVSSTSLLGGFIKKIHKGELILKTSNEEDYGLCPAAMEFVKKHKPDLLITLDFGTTNHVQIDELASLGIKVIVLDHHEIPERIPDCYLVSPKRKDSAYPNEKICTSVLALKFIQAYLYSSLEEFDRAVWIPDGNSLFSGYLIHRGKLLFRGERQDLTGKFPFPISEQTYTFESAYPEREWFYYEFLKYPALHEQYLQSFDLASIGTVSDMMPLYGENRIIVKEGCKILSRLRKRETSHREGLYQLLQLVEMDEKKVTSKDLGWSLGPMINSAGRMNRTHVALDLLMEENPERAKTGAKELQKLNEERRERTKRNLFKVDGFLKRKTERTQKPVLFCYEPDFEPGVSGIVATRLVEEYKKPVLFITPDHGHAKGSIRSYGKENVLNLLKKAESVFFQFGGHKEAGGFSLEVERIPELAKIVFDSAETWLQEEQKRSAEDRTESLISLDPTELNAKLFQELSVFEPFGHENPIPLISIKNAKIYHTKPMTDGKHVRFRILGAPESIQCLLWNRGKEFMDTLSVTGSLDLWGSLEESTYRSKTSLQFVVGHFRPVEKNSVFE